MVAQWLWITGAVIYGLLAGLHLLYTFFTNKFSVRDSATEEMMKKAYPVLTRKTTMWKAWIGFNGSHSIGGIYLGIVNLYLQIGPAQQMIHTLLFSQVYLLFG